jgi:hypothetical protein
VFVRISLGEHEHTILREHCYAIHMRRDHKENLLLHHFDERTFGSLELLPLSLFVFVFVCLSMSLTLYKYVYVYVLCMFVCICSVQFSSAVYAWLSICLSTSRESRQLFVVSLTTTVHCNLNLYPSYYCIGCVFSHALQSVCFRSLLFSLVLAFRVACVPMCGG